MTGHELHYGKSIRNNTPKLIQLLRNYDVGYVKKTRDGRLTGDQIEAALKLKCYDTSMLLWKADVAVSHCGNLPLGELRSEGFFGQIWLK